MRVPDLPVPDPNVKRTPLDIEAAPRWEIVRDLATGKVLVSTGIRSAIQTVGRDGRFEIDRVGRASVSAARPDGAFVEGEATIKLQTPRGSNVSVQSRLRVTQDGQDFRASVTMDGQLIFEHRWASERSEKMQTVDPNAARAYAGARAVGPPNRRD